MLVYILQSRVFVFFSLLGSLYTLSLSDLIQTCDIKYHHHQYADDIQIDLFSLGLWLNSSEYIVTSSNHFWILIGISNSTCPQMIPWFHLFKPGPHLRKEASIHSVAQAKNISLILDLSCLHPSSTLWTHIFGSAVPPDTSGILLLITLSTTEFTISHPTFLPASILADCSHKATPNSQSPNEFLPSAELNPQSCSLQDLAALAPGTLPNAISCWSFLLWGQSLWSPGPSLNKPQNLCTLLSLPGFCSCSNSPSQ